MNTNTRQTSTTDRLQFALKHLEPSDWHRFEKLASAFLTGEFSDLRTMASASGDGGRDSELFGSPAEPKVLLQYSVAADWESKVEKTVRRIDKTFPKCTILVFVSSQVIGARSDVLKTKLRQEQGLTLDIRDRNWFVERAFESPTRERAAEELARIIVDPLVPDSHSISGFSPALSPPEAVAALTFLSLQWRDDVRGKGLTKLVFEALVRSALASTSNEQRMSRSEIHVAVLRVLPEKLPPPQVADMIDSALNRLTKKAVRHWKKGDEFCLSHEEQERIRQFRIDSSLAEANLVIAIRQICTAILTIKKVPRLHVAELSVVLRGAVEDVLKQQSQSFAMAVQRGSLSSVASLDSRSLLISHIARSNLNKIKDVDWLDVLRIGVREVLLSDDDAIQVHMRSLADAYTLMAFLRLTPDVQKVVEKMFSHGKVWLDATVLLPLFTEALSDGVIGRFTRMIEAAREGGIKLFVTPGAIEEVERHMNMALTCARPSGSQWVGPIPFLLGRYIESGRSIFAFNSWLETFRGNARPEEDLGDYLRDRFEIEVRDLQAERASANEQLRYAVQAHLYESHRRRREKRGREIDEMTLTRLVEHDVECYCGVIQLRKNEKRSPFGYSAWWLTLDRTIFDLNRILASELSGAPDSPVLSADFMVNYLAFGPTRSKIGKDIEAQLPLVMEPGAVRYLTPELLEEAEKLRTELKDLPDHIIRRRVRDHLDQARRQIGPVALAGLGDPVEEDFRL